MNGWKYYELKKVSIFHSSSNTFVYFQLYISIIQIFCNSIFWCCVVVMMWWLLIFIEFWWELRIAYKYYCQIAFFKFLLFFFFKEDGNCYCIKIEVATFGSSNSSLNRELTNSRINSSCVCSFLANNSMWSRMIPYRCRKKPETLWNFTNPSSNISSISEKKRWN